MGEFFIEAKIRTENSVQRRYSADLAVSAAAAVPKYTDPPLCGSGRYADTSILRIIVNTDLHRAGLKIWQGWKDSNLRMPESKSGALTNLATPLHRTIVVANNRPINRRLQTHSRERLFYQPARGCISRFLHLRIIQSSGAAKRSASCKICANTALPEPVMRP